MEKLIKGFISWAELRDGSEKGKADRQRNALYFLSYCEEKKLTDAAAIGRNILDEYSRYLREERGYTEDSVKNRRNTVIFFLSYLRDEKGLKILYHREREAEKAALPDLPEGLLRVYLEYVSWMEQKGHRKITVYGRRKNAGYFLSYLKEKGMTDLREAGRKEVEEYSRYLKEEKKLTAASVVSMRKESIFFFKWLSGVKGLGMKFSEERKEEEEKAKEAVYRLEGPGMPEEFRRGYAEYLRQKVITKTPEGTLEGIRFSLRVFYQYLSERGASSYATIKGEDARDYVKYLTERKVKATGQPLKAVSINRNISDVKSHLKWLHKRGYSRGLWDQLRKLLKEHTVKANVLSRKEIVKLFNIKAERPYDFMIKTVLALLYASGVRIGELLELKRPDIDLTNGEAHIFETKTGKDRAVQLGEVGTTYLKLYLEQVRPLVLPKGSANPYLFVKVMEGTDLKAKRLSIPQMERYIQKFTKIAGVQKRVSCHTFRHTYGTHLLENGAKTKYVADLLGHKDLGTTEQYLHLSPAHLRETLLKYHPMEA